MKIVFLEATVDDLMWFRRYYRAVFPEGAENAKLRLTNLLTLLAANPYMGQAVPDFQNVRKVPIPKTPFALIYRVSASQIEVLRVRDGRSREAAI
ncbi:MAG: type II toxin-antitoxin system RelE/ParE family toxin [Pseudomonadota bacterium]